MSANFGYFEEAACFYQCLKRVKGQGEGKGEVSPENKTLPEVNLIQEYL